VAPEERWVYSGIRVRDLARSVRFYRAIGFRVVKRGGFSHGGRWVHLVYPRSGHRLELNYYPKGTPFYEPFRAGTEFDHFGFFVTDPRAWLRRMIRAGATPVIGFVDGPAELLYVKDPDGIWLAACGPSEPGALPRIIESADRTAVLPALREPRPRRAPRDPGHRLPRAKSHQSPRSKRAPARRPSRRR
jgi:catechol 2,3-dioxygenase-like lactoylglutathione lyase family enzyme